MKVPSEILTKRSDGTESEIIHTPSEKFSYDSSVGFPGLPPFTRGVQPTMYRGQFWTMRQYAGFGTAQETNGRFHHLLNQGQTGLSVAFDLPTQMGFDADDSMARGEVGRVGVAISSLQDMETLFAGIPLDRVSTSMTINATASILLSLYLSTAKKQGIPFDQIRGTVQNDILKEYIARGTYIFPPKASMRIVTDLIIFCAREVPQWNPISISGYHIREAGSDAVQEVAFTLANACAYSEAVIHRGLPFDEFAGRLSFFFASHSDLIEETAKFRAARRLWAKIATERFKAKNDRSKMLRFHAQTAGSTLTAQQPNNNLARVTIQALAAILGGCQSLHTNSRDEALALPTEVSATLALRTQQILAYESGVANTIDPVAGSYTLEAETDRIEKSAELLIAEIDRMGGSVAAIEKGYFQKAIAERAYEFQKQIETGERKIVGVNAFESDSTVNHSILRVNPKLEESQRARVAKWKTDRNRKAVDDALLALQAAAKTDDNLIPSILNAVECCCTLGEISKSLRNVFGQYSPNTRL